MAFVDKWDSDWQELTGDNGEIATFIQEQKDYDQAVLDYHAGMERLKHVSDASKAFALLALLLANQGFNQLNGKQAVNGGDLQIQSTLTQLNNALEEMTNQSDDATVKVDSTGAVTYTYNQSPADSYLHKVAVRSNDISQLLTNNKDLRAAIGDDAADALASQFQIIRYQIWDTQKDAGNNMPGMTSSSGPAQGIYFDDSQPQANGVYAPDQDACMTSYAEFQHNLSNKGDDKLASESAKQKTDAFNENTSTTQSTNAASQEQISNDSNLTKAIQAFVSDMFHAMMDVISAANKASARGS